MRISAFLTLVALTAEVKAVPFPATHTVHEKRGSPPSQWMKRVRTHPDSILPIRIGLTQSNLDKAHDYLMDVWVTPVLRYCLISYSADFQYKPAKT